MTSDNSKFQRLEQAFEKAIDSSQNAITEADLQMCFGELKAQFGASLQKSFVNTISKTAKKMENSFKQINTDYEVEAYLQSMASGTIQESGDASNRDKNQMDVVVESTTNEYTQKKCMTEVNIALRKVEIEDITKGIRGLEAEIRKTKEQAGRLKTQLLNEVDAISIENMKIKHATEQFGEH